MGTDVVAAGAAISARLQTRALQALRYRFTVASNIEWLPDYLDNVLHRLLDPDASTDHRYEVEATGDRMLQVSIDGVPFAACPDLSVAMEWLLWHVNQSAAASVVGQVVLHAGGVQVEELGILLPGPSGAGKSSLVAALVDRGLGYLSDELLVLGFDGERVDGYPRPLALRAGALTALPRWRAASGAEFGGSTESVLLVDPERVVPGCSGGPCTPAVVVAPRYVQGSGASLTALTASEGLVELVANSVRFGPPDPQHVDVLARLARRCQCYRLDFGDLGEASEMIVGLVA